MDDKNHKKSSVCNVIILEQKENKLVIKQLFCQGVEGNGVQTMADLGPSSCSSH